MFFFLSPKTTVHQTTSLLCFLILSLATSKGAYCQSTPSNFSPEVRRILKEGRTNNQAHHHLDHLCNQIGSRLTGSDGERAASVWAKEKFQEFGLENVTREKWGTIPVGFQRGPAKGQMLNPKKINLDFGTPAWSRGTKGRAVGEVVFAPNGIQELRNNPNRFDGKWLLVPQGTPFRPRGPMGKDQRRNYRRLLQRIKPLGLIQSSRTNLIITNGNYKVNWEKLPKLPNIRLSKDHFQEVSKLVKKGQRVVLSFDIRNHFRKGPVDCFNVFADIKGTEKPEEIVIIGAHLDSWDEATGATDNASGCAAVIEAARILSKANVQPRRTIRFVLWSGKEQGLLGSKGYLKKHARQMDEVVAVFVMDGGTNHISGIDAPESMQKSLKSAFQPLFKLDERKPFELGTTNRIPDSVNNDHIPFLEAGVPSFLWKQKGKAVSRITQHTQFDTFDTVVPEYQKHSSIVLAIGSLGVANLKQKLPRVTPRERTIRKKP